MSITISHLSILEQPTVPVWRVPIYIHENPHVGGSLRLMPGLHYGVARCRDRVGLIAEIRQILDLCLNRIECAPAGMHNGQIVSNIDGVADDATREWLYEAGINPIRIMDRVLAGIGTFIWGVRFIDLDNTPQPIHLDFSAQTSTGGRVLHPHFWSLTYPGL